MMRRRFLANMNIHPYISRHCESGSDEAIQFFTSRHLDWLREFNHRAALAPTRGSH